MSTFQFSSLSKSVLKPLQKYKAQVPNPPAPSAQRSRVIFADVLTMLFESTARLIEDSYPLVETYYGTIQLKFEIISGFNAGLLPLDIIERTSLLTWVVQTRPSLTIS